MRIIVFGVALLDQKAAEALEAAKRKIDCLLTQAQGVKVGKGCSQELKGSAVGFEGKEEPQEGCYIGIEGCQAGEVCRYDIVIEVRWLLGFTSS